MSSKWEHKRLGDLCELRAGSAFPQRYQGKRAGRYPFIKVSDLSDSRNGVFIRCAANWVDEDERLALKAKPLPNGAVVFAKIGEGLKRNRRRLLLQPTLLDNNLMGAIPRREVVEPRFLHHAMAQIDLGEVAGGSALPYLTARDLAELMIAVPPLAEQRRIAGVLGVLDDSIEVERRKRENLDDLIRLAGGALARDGAAEWPLEQLGDHYSVSRGLSYKGAGLVDGSDGAVPLHNLNSVLEGGGYKYEGVKYYVGEFKERHRTQPGDLVVANTEQGFDELLIAYPALVPAVFGRQGIYSHHLHRVVPRDGSHLTSYWLYIWLLSKANHDLVAGYANGTTVNMLPVDALLDPMIPIPPVERVRALDGLVAPAIRLAEASHRETVTLAAIRETLLPKLVSGHVRVPESYDPEDALGTVEQTSVS
jgi:type I restriction enzyme S subunit